MFAGMIVLLGFFLVGSAVTILHSEHGPDSDDE